MHKEVEYNIEILLLSFLSEDVCMEGGIKLKELIEFSLLLNNGNSYDVILVSFGNNFITPIY